MQQPDAGAPRAEALLGALFCLLPVAGMLAGPLYAPAVFGVAVVLVLWFSATGRRAGIRLDWVLAGLLLAFVGLAVAGLHWTVDPKHTFSAVLQASAVLPAALCFLAVCRAARPGFGVALAPYLVTACLLGAALPLTDGLDGDVVLKLAHGADVWPSKYNRGLDHALLLMLPLTGYCVARRWWLPTGLLVLSGAGAVAVGVDATAMFGLVAAAAIAGLGALAPAAVWWLLAGGTTLMMGALPFALRLITPERAVIAPYLKHSGLDRLEIWDYLSAHVLQRPWLGAGLGTSRVLQATPEQLALYVRASGHGIYPHNQFLELWVEMGAAGVVIGLAFLLVVLWRIWRLPRALRPFGYGAYVLAMMIASSGFEVVTDSWWAALAASGALFGLLARALPVADAASVAAELAEPSDVVEKRLLF